MTRLPNNKLQRGDCEFLGDIITIRSIEDCIRTTRKYTESLKTRRVQHPVQGDEFSSRSFCKFYEVYPEIEWDWEMGSGDAIDLLWGDTPIINVIFNYDYRSNKASMVVDGKTGALAKLLDGIPSLCAVLSPDMTSNGHREDVSRIISQAKATEKRRLEMAAVPPVKSTKAWDRVIDFLTPRKARKVQ